eukprot:3240862-Amphidinium_carterae.1
MKNKSLLRELVVKLRMRKNIARVDSALGVNPHSNNRPGARSLEAPEANEARTSPKPKKKAETPPRRKLCSSYASAKGCAQGELRPLFEKGGHPRMHNKCWRCGSEEHLVKSCTRATRKREARAAQAEEAPDDPEAEDPEQEDDEPDAAPDKPEYEEDQEEADDTELDPDNDEYDIVDPDDDSVETVDANAMNKGRGRGRGQGQGSGGKGGGRGRKSSSRGRAPSKPHQKPKSSPRKPPGLAGPSARMFNVGPVLEPEPHHPLADLNPHNPPHPASALGKLVIRASNVLRKQLIGRRRDNIGNHHDSSPSDANSDLTSDEDFNEHPDLAMMKQ